MAFTLPQFNTALDRWVNPNRPSLGPPDFTNQMYQVYVWSKQANYWFDSTTGKYFPTIIIREQPVPSNFAQPGDVLGKDTGVTQFPFLWLVLFKTAVHLNFPNRYQTLYCVACGRNGAPIPNPSP
jgi:hypothetical protein